MKVSAAAVLLVVALLAGAEVLAQSSASVAVDNRRAQLERDLSLLEAEIAEQQKFLEAKQRERVSLERDVSILDAQIEKARLSIRARDLTIKKLTGEIRGKETTIGALDEKLAREKASLAELLRKTHELDETSLPVLIFGNQTLASFLSDTDSFQSIARALSASFSEIEETKGVTKKEKSDLEAIRSEELELRRVQELQKRKIEAQERQKKDILRITKGQEGAYQSLIASKQKTAAEIRAELFQLRGSAAIPFEKAYEYAKAAAAETGVRPAFILGIIAEESNLGENVGTGSWLVDMHPTRDRPIFEAITASLSLDPNKVPVSKKAWYGWGGAMGPAQFIPSTWALYAGYEKGSGYAYNAAKDRIGKRTGNTPSNPWNPQDALMGAALYLSDSGADAKTSRAEFIAAMCYLAGCRNASNKQLQFYGDDVMCLALKYQKSIDILEATNVAAGRQGDIYHAQCL